MPAAWHVSFSNDNLGQHECSVSCMPCRVVSSLPRAYALSLQPVVGLMSHCNLNVSQAIATLNGVQQSLSGTAPGAKKRTRHSSNPSKTKSEDLAKHSFPTLQSSSMAEHESDDSLDWPTTGPFTYHRWHVMIERWAQWLRSSPCIA